MKRYVPYLRVSTDSQGREGLGIQAQRQAIQAFAKDALLLPEHVEVESGKRNERPKLAEAIVLAKAQNATLLIAKLDRLSRNAGFIFALRDSGVQFVCCDMPDANTLTVGLFAVIAQYERETISKRTKDALAAKKATGFTLGKPENLTAAARMKGTLASQFNAQEDEHNQRASALIVALKEKGCNYLQIANRLNELKFKTRRGGLFRAEQVKRLYLRATTQATSTD